MQRPVVCQEIIRTFPLKLLNDVWYFLDVCTAKLVLLMCCYVASQLLQSIIRAVTCICTAVLWWCSSSSSISCGGGGGGGSSNSKMKVLITCYEIYSVLNWALEGIGWSALRTGRPGTDCSRRNGLLGQFEWALAKRISLVPIGNREPHTIQHVANNYIDYAIPVPEIVVVVAVVVVLLLYQ